LLVQRAILFPLADKRASHLASQYLRLGSFFPGQAIHRSQVRVSGHLVPHALNVLVDLFI
jgi:hypothetical protein